MSKAIQEPLDNVDFHAKGTKINISNQVNVLTYPSLTAELSGKPFLP